MNTFTDSGLNRVRDLISGVSTAYVTHMAIGNGDSASPGSCSSPTGSETALGNELARVAVARDTSVGTGQVKFTASFTPASGTWDSVCEAGLFDADSGGTLIAYTNIGPYTLDTNTTLTIEWTLTFSRS